MWQIKLIPLIYSKVYIELWLLRNSLSVRPSFPVLIRSVVIWSGQFALVQILMTIFRSPSSSCTESVGLISLTGEAQYWF